jgi:hypothetical protein
LAVEISEIVSKGSKGQMYHRSGVRTKCLPPPFLTTPLATLTVQ